MALAALLAGFLAAPIAPAAGVAPPQPDEVDPDDVLPSVAVGESGDAAAAWTAGTSLDGFELTAAPDDGTTTTATDADGAGPGVIAALAVVALAAAALVARR
ncbi:hypothetical protein BRD02_06680 [Halobacteriales archaeon QS_8_69_73]|nr:MAG: hypothetical protein BRD02_06680 [Halobacteriales archaeon QS_8_69_73]